MKNRLFAFGVSLILLAAVAAQAGPASRGLLIVLNKSDHEAVQVAVIHTATRKVLARFSPGNEPDGIAWANR